MVHAKGESLDASAGHDMEASVMRSLQRLCADVVCGTARTPGVTRELPAQLGERSAWSELPDSPSDRTGYSPT